MTKVHDSCCEVGCMIMESMHVMDGVIGWVSRSCVVVHKRLLVVGNMGDWDTPFLNPL
eukprot:COSAG02_NODE_434_length_22429_cov_15.013704_4_plen_58_part_00